MRRIVSIALSLLLFTTICQLTTAASVATDGTTHGISTYSEQEPKYPPVNQDTSVNLEIDLPAGTSPLITNETELKAALAIDTYTTYLIKSENPIELSGKLPQPANANVTFVSVTGNPITLLQKTPQRHFEIILTKNMTMTFENIILDGNNAGGGIYLRSAYNNTLTLSNAYITKCKAVSGGGIEVNSEHLTLNNCTLTYNTATKPSSGGGAINMNTTTNTLTLTGSNTFSRNTATDAYWIRKDSDHEYLGTKATALKETNDTQYKPYISELSAPPQDCDPFQYLYNNYDLNYTGTAASKISPGQEKLIFTDDTAIPDLIYEGTAGNNSQMLTLKSTEPVIKIYNTTGKLWDLKITYTPFKVNDINEPNLQFTKHTTNTEYTPISANTAHTIFTATKEWEPNYTTTVPWKIDNNEKLKVLLPEKRYDLAEQNISTAITWTLQITP